MKEKRTKRIEIQLFEEEYQRLQNRKTKPRLAEWIREVCLDKEEIKAKPLSKVDEKYLNELIRIGTNLNQVARWCNTNKTGFEKMELLSVLSNIEAELKSLKLLLVE